MRAAEELVARLAERAIAMDGTCTGEHGIGQGKMRFPGAGGRLGARRDALHQAGDRSARHHESGQDRPDVERRRGRRGRSALSKLFIAAGILIIAVLFTALIGPYFVDWTAYRDIFEREASAYIGRPVTVAGKASVRLLPTPVLSFTDIRVGDAEAPDVEMERFRAEVELAPLLKGEVRIIQMAVERPRFRFDLAGLAGDQGLSAERWRIDPERISLERLEIVEGSASISDSRTGRRWQAEGIDAVGRGRLAAGAGPSGCDAHARREAVRGARRASAAWRPTTPSPPRFRSARRLIR